MQRGATLGDTIVIGCGSSLRGDDAIGSAVARALVDRGVPAGVTVVDAGTDGVTVALRMRGARRVILVDAASSGADPGAIHRLAGPDIERLGRSAAPDLHRLRWDHAVALAQTLLGDECPGVVVYLVEAASFGLGEPLTPTASEAVERLVAHLLTVELPEG